MRPTQSLGLIAIVVPDYDAGIAFYVDKMGFDLVQDEDQGEGKRWVVVRPHGGVGSDILLAQAKGADQEAAIGNQTGGRVGFFLKTSDFATDHARMLENGVTFEEDPRHEIYGSVAVFRDPFGNRWDLLGPAPEVK
ncbi:VOC family protein [Halocynthiibacter styelae]|uniref:VOC family protein n=1 Tax=Halocynthiibacter styelae TaxID=2761955 RepID=A0A8J7IEP7_9RHOB|nr:VOC family protein [Paenihalocynthiibacter styelae]MBI1493887.1 VOC family protein [Paenihalocynthiibacter styelae]